jgi:hypothetical protein
MLKKFILPIILFSFLFAGCSTEVEVNADFVEQTIVYGLISPSSNEQLIRVNRSFLTDGDNFAAAQNRELTEYRAEDVTLFLRELNQQGQVVNSFASDAIMVNKMEGIFFGGQHRVWRINTPAGLNAERDYRLEIQVGDREISAESNVLQWPGSDEQTIVSNNLRPATRVLNMMSSAGAGNFVPDYLVRWNGVRNGRRYTISAGFVYDEHRTNGTVEQKVTNTTLRNERLENILTNLADKAFVFSPQVLFTSAANQIRTNNEDEISKRVIRAIRFSLTAVNDDVATFIDVNQPVTGIVQGINNFTNIENGLGIFGARTTIKRDYIVSTALPDDRIHPQTLNEILNGSITGDLKFETE